MTAEHREAMSLRSDIIASSGIMIKSSVSILKVLVEAEGQFCER